MHCNNFSVKKKNAAIGGQVQVPDAWPSAYHWAPFNVSGDCTPIPSSVNQVKSKTWRARDDTKQ